jgi:hypothetical protein
VTTIYCGLKFQQPQDIKIGKKCKNAKKYVIIRGKGETMCKKIVCKGLLLCELKKGRA